MSRSTLALRDDGIIGQGVVVNGRVVAWTCAIDSIERDGSYAWIVRRGAAVYTIWGGKASGGASDEWYLESETAGIDIPCRSLTEAVRLVLGA